MVHPSARGYPSITGGRCFSTAWEEICLLTLLGIGHRYTSTVGMEDLFSYCQRGSILILLGGGGDGEIGDYVF